MKGIASLLILLLFFVGCSCPSATPTPTPSPQPPTAASPETTASPEHAEQLARQFCPIIYLKGEGEATESFEPEQIEIMVDEALVLDIEDPLFSEEATLPSLRQWSRGVYYLDLADLGPTTNPDEYKVTYDQIKNSYAATLYARVVERTGEGYTVVQYWIFYYFNDWRNLHEGDWELVQLCFPGQTAQELLEQGRQPLFAAYSQHQAGQRMSWGDMQANGLVEGTHPMVYVSRGSHANYFTPGDYWSGLDFDNTGASSWQVISPEQLNIVLLPEIEAEGEKAEWLGFKGHWGEYLGFSVSVFDLKFWQCGPFGPPWSEGEQKSGKWENPAKWAAGLPEYPEPFWTFFFSLPGDWFNRAFFCLFSPADIHVYDSMGRHVGVNEKGEVEMQIPESVYITPEGTQYKTIVIPEADISQEYTLIVNGTGSGNMELKIQVPDAQNGVKCYLEFTNVPVSATTTARVNIVPEQAIELELDSDGDGFFELESTPGNFEEHKVVIPALEVEIDIEPDTLLPGSVAQEQSITAYIELPKGYYPEDIDIATVRLMAEIPAWEKPIYVVDHDQDGLPELMVMFDRQLVIDYLESQGLIEGEVSLTLTGVIGDRPFIGADTIIITERG